ncbi:hypothetical protein [Bdellovibrio bacteriovorus]|uniref:hypothetical protein n=1 Tax=Bdellovibrio bacteriovorus TaxID=959 RepID=UPI0035A62E90
MLRSYFYYFTLFCAFFAASKDCEANQSGLFPSTRFSAYQSIYSGEPGKSFAETATGLGAGITVFMDGKRLIPYFGFKVGSMTGTQTFLDGTAEVSSSFKYYNSTAEAGLQLFVIERKKRGFNVYFSGGGVLGYNFVALGKTVELQNIHRSDQSFSTGYAAGIGSEWILTSANNNKWNFNSEVLYKSEGATLFNSKYDLSCMVFSIGLGW